MIYSGINKSSNIYVYMKYTQFRKVEKIYNMFRIYFSNFKLYYKFCINSKYNENVF